MDFSCSSVFSMAKEVFISRLPMRRTTGMSPLGNVRRVSESFWRVSLVVPWGMSMMKGDVVRTLVAPTPLSRGLDISPRAGEMVGGDEQGRWAGEDEFGIWK